MVRLRPYGCVFALSLYCFFLLVASQKTHPAEVTALAGVKSKLIDHMKHLENWINGDPCTSKWTGILCFDVVGGDGYLHVKELHLMNMNLTGTLAPELGHLNQLEIINFMWNDLTGSIPKEIGNIPPLRLLLLNGNRLSGVLPDELGYLAKLNRFQIDQNQISGLIPKSFSNLRSIKHIHFNNNTLSGQIPPELSNLTTLLHLLLDNNNLSGHLPPEFSNLLNLRIIQLDNNNFRGSTIPASYANLSKLAKISLRNCNLQGGIPDFSKIPALGYLDLSWNQLTGSIPKNKLSENITTIDLSHNQLNGSIPDSLSYLPNLQKVSLENNSLSGSVGDGLWQNKSFSSAARLLIDLRNNLLLNFSTDIGPPANVTLRLYGNPVCRNVNIRNIGIFCQSEAGTEFMSNYLANSTVICPIQACPVDNNFEYVPASPIPCFCASPLKIGYRLKSPSFSYFPPYVSSFKSYVTFSLNLDLYQLSIDSYVWEKGPRLRMCLKLFPVANLHHVNTFNTSEVLRISQIFSTWQFPGSDFFGPYELLNVTLLGPYSYVTLKPAKTANKGIFVAIVLAAVVIVVMITAVVTILTTRKYTRYHHILSNKHMSSRLSVKIEGVKSFTFKELASSTDDFNSSTQVGQGGYGAVYKGTLADGTVVAVKRAKEGSLQGKKEFLTEIELLSRLHHRNLVALLGYCDEEGEQMLVYEFMPNGTLRDWISAKSKETLTFGARLQIALGAAKGILYLHTEAHPPIFHRDIKTSNILLDSRLTAKVADFGLSRLAPVIDDEGAVPDHVSTIVKGTPGYLDPEYFLTHKLTDKSDVYSLGVVFLEVLTGMRPISHGKNIVREVNMAQKAGATFSVIDSRMGSYPSESVEKFIALALRCCQDKPEDRPSVLDIVRELENILSTTPESAIDSSDPKSRYSSDSATTSSSDASRDLIAISNVSGGGLVSGITLTNTILPR